MPKRPFLLVHCSLLLAFHAFTVAEPTAQDIEFFETRIRPLFAEHCFKCHSTKAKKLKGGLYLDSHAGVLKGGDTGPILVPGEPDKSRIIEAVRYNNPDLQMPAKSKLPDKAIGDLVEWVKRGAPWPKGDGTEVVMARKEVDYVKRRSGQWCFQPLKKSKPPQTKGPALSDIDRFILKRLEKEGIIPAPGADKGTLIRRATFDLIGLPPTPKEIEDFLKDESANAFEKVIDRLLVSPHFGEKWARHFMDLVRYAESRGHEFDPNHPNSFEYRDYLIRALNEDVPYDQFVKEAVAGDLIPNPRKHPTEGWNESVLGTGFWFFGEWVHSPVDIRGDECDRQANMVDVFSKTFLAQTLLCARCHEHKFDAIPQSDFYAIAGYIQSSAYRQVRFETLEHNAKISRELAALRKKHAPEILKDFAAANVPSIEKLSNYLLATREVLQSDVEFASGELKVFDSFESGDYHGWTAEGKAFGDRPVTKETTGTYQGKINAIGKFYVNSHNQRSRDKVVHSDRETGKLTSKKFRIDHNFITFMVGGGGYRNKTCINLLIDGKKVLSRSGFNHNTMRLHRWDVRRFASKTAQFQIVDEIRGGWGNIGVDHIVFQKTADDRAFYASRQIVIAPAPTDVAADEKEDEDDVLGELKEEENAAQKPKVNPFEALLKKTAAKYQVAPKRLESFVFAVMTARNEPNNPLRPWGMIAENKKVTSGQIAEAAASFPFKPVTQNARPESGTTGQEIENGELIVDYTKPGHDWIQDGPVFGEGPVQAGDLIFGEDASRPIAGIHSSSAAFADPLWSRLQLAPGTHGEPGSLGKLQRAGRNLRTKTFTLKHRNMSYLVKGAGYALVVVDSHRMIQGPLHGRLVKRIDLKNATPRWTSQDLRTDYLGHRVHVEFIPDKDAAFVIYMVAQADAPMKKVTISSLEEAPRFPNEGIDSAEKLAATYQTYFGKALDALQSGQKIAPPIMSWLLDNSDLLMDEKAMLASASAKAFFEKQSELINEIKFKSRTAPAMWDGTAENEILLIRGNHKTPAEPVARRFMSAFVGEIARGASGPKTTASKTSERAEIRGSGRLQLAETMTDPRITPVLPRVQVNRIWHHLFGRGIVPTVDDFGNMGQAPTHPDLLDYLASRLIALGWSNKKLIREILLSDTWQMSSKPGTADEIDPSNKLYHRMAIRRLTGESIRDAILSISGRLDRKLYGHSVPVYLSAQMQGRGRPRGGPVDGAGRRSVYLAVRRNFLSSFLKTFDRPIPFSSMGRRNVSNVPTQALILMNAPFVVGQAKLWGRNLAQQSDKTPEVRIQDMYLAAFGRPASENELLSAKSFIDSQAKLYAGDINAAEVWSDLGHVLMNVKEFIYLN
ncbi:MAG: PSD1 and planctomycete cytochrome C domain-containing protein [Planctomycetota bacterium]|nr:PSD1 and planctomycete cytochrome C domain-containing protein [Planctomycetota bacterium]